MGARGTPDVNSEVEDVDVGMATVGGTFPRMDGGIILGASS